MADSRSLHLVLVEDVLSDAELAVRLLEQSGLTLTWTRVGTAEALGDALRARTPDVVLSDFRLLGFGGLEALAQVRAFNPRVPFIMFTGALDDERAVECLKSGAWDYVLKDKPARLPFAVRDAVDKARSEAESSRFEVALAHAQKMEAVGRLAGGVSHDFNNLLTGILGYCDLLLTAMPRAAPYRADVLQIQAVSQRAATLTRQLLAFSRRQAMSPIALSLTALLSDLKKPVRTMLRADIDLLWDLAQDLPDISGDPGQIEQAVYNLVSNAGEAMKDGGTLTIRTAASTLDDGFVRVHPGARVGPYVSLVVADSGPGMTPEMLNHVFEPFYLTWGAEPGLGLAAVYGIVKQNGGYVTAESAPGDGATFTLYFPLLHADVADAAARGNPAGAPGTGGETILFVEDDESLRVVLRRVLEGYGYRVLEAVDGTDAVTNLLREAGRIDVLLTDLVLPGCHGGEVARRFREANPSLVVVFMSGYSEPAILKDIKVDATTVLIKKPYLPSALASQIRGLLDRRFRR